MQVYLNNKNRIENIECGTAVALGRFDAIHIGHIEIIKNTVVYAKENGILSLVYMFINDPAEFTSKKKILSVNTIEKRIAILEAIGVDIVVADNFDSNIMNISPDTFVNEFLVERFNAKFVSAGYNYHFGKCGAGNIDTLKALCEEKGIIVSGISEIKVNGKPVSSTIIRNKIADGEVKKVAELMGRHYSISGVVVRGDGIGREKLGFPTANIELPKTVVVAKNGVYVSKTYLDGKLYNSITNIGGKPTINNEPPRAETYIDATLSDLYGKEIKVELYKYLRPVLKFESIDALAEQLSKDKIEMRKYFELEKGK